MEIDELNSNGLLDKDKLTYDKSDERFEEHTEKMCGIESTLIVSEPCTSSESVKNNLTDDKNDNISNNSTSQPSELDITLTTADATNFNSDTGKNLLAELREKYSADLQIETYYILKVKCPSEHSKTINRQIEKFLNRNSLKNDKWDLIKSDFDMLPSIFKLTDPHDLWTRWKALNRKLYKKSENEHNKKCMEEQMSTLQKQLSAFLIGKEKMRGEKRTLHYLGVLDKFFTGEDKNLNNEVINAHRFIFLSTPKSIKKLVQEWDEQQKNVKTSTQTDDNNAQTETTRTPEITETTEDLMRYADELLTICRNNRFRGQLEFVKKRIRSNECDSNIKKLLFRIGRTFKVPYTTIDNNEKL